MLIVDHSAWNIKHFDAYVIETLFVIFTNIFLQKKIKTVKQAYEALLVHDFYSRGNKVRRQILYHLIRKKILYNRKQQRKVFDGRAKFNGKCPSANVFLNKSLSYLQYTLCNQKRWYFCFFNFLHMHVDSWLFACVQN